jgi:hypothetical protein
MGPRLHADMVVDTFKRAGRWIKLPEDEVAAIRGQIIRVGASQDLLALNIDFASVMQAGRWKPTHMPMRYGEHVLAARAGMARTAIEEARDSFVPPPGRVGIALTCIEATRRSVKP